MVNVLSLILGFCIGCWLFLWAMAPRAVYVNYKDKAANIEIVENGGKSAGLYQDSLIIYQIQYYRMTFRIKTFQNHIHF